MAYAASNVNFHNNRKPIKRCERLRSQFEWDKKSILWELCNVTHAFGLSSVVAGGSGIDNNPSTPNCRRLNYPQEYASLLDYDFINSHKFNAGCHPENFSNWSISLCKKFYPNFIGVFLHLIAIEKESQVNCRRSNDVSFDTEDYEGLFIRYSFSVLSQAGTVLKRIENPTTIHMKIGDSWGEDCFIPMESLQDPNSHIISDDTFRIKLDLWIFHDCNNEIVENYKSDQVSLSPWLLQLSGNEKEVSEDKNCFPENVHSICNGISNDKSDSTNKILKTLWETRDFADISINCGDQVFQVHKCILCAASPVFNAMFLSGMDETVRNEVSISDISPEVLEIFIYYIYNGEMPSTWKWGNNDRMFEILNACEKYQIQELKESCGKLLIDNLTIENAGDAALMAHLFFYENEVLQELIFSFIARNLVTLRKNLSFQSAIESRPAAFSKLLLSDSLKNVINS